MMDDKPKYKQEYIDLTAEKSLQILVDESTITEKMSDRIVVMTVDQLCFFIAFAVDATVALNNVDKDLQEQAFTMLDQLVGIYDNCEGETFNKPEIVRH